ncbi:TetR/AcrR family transcriptional regulator [Pedococcus ginsenosidimutans]|uniref:TetR/AcrR family transcriptional regulator n=2 Tax=Pedococcus ginsenosidimutans TaxID=490570 RepID=A0ABP8YI66_9MICO
MRLVQATLQILRTTPVDKLSLRRVAEQVGVSHQAPYVHFGSKRRFLAAVAGVGLDRAADAAEIKVAAAGSSPISRLRALARAYTEWVTHEPHVHDLDLALHIAKSEHPWLQTAAIRYWNLLHDTVEACQPPGVSEADVLRRCTIVWGAVYGISRLAALGQVPASVPGDASEHISFALDALFAGWHAAP